MRYTVVTVHDNASSLLFACLAGGFVSTHTGQTGLRGRVLHTVPSRDVLYVGTVRPPAPERARASAITTRSRARCPSHAWSAVQFACPTTDGVHRRGHLDPSRHASGRRDDTWPCPGSCPPPRLCISTWVWILPTWHSTRHCTAPLALAMSATACARTAVHGQGSLIDETGTPMRGSRSNSNITFRTNPCQMTPVAFAPVHQTRRRRCSALCRSKPLRFRPSLTAAHAPLPGLSRRHHPRAMGPAWYRRLRILEVSCS